MCDRATNPVKPVQQTPGKLVLTGGASKRKAEIDHVAGLSASIGNLLMSDVFSDVTLIVDNQRFPAHRVIMASRSDYFRAMFFCGMRETTDKEVVLRDTPVIAFKAILSFIYTGKLRLTDMKEEVVLDTLGLAHQYEFPALESSIAEYLQSILNVENVCVVYDAASLYGQARLEQTCLQFMDKNAPQVIRHESFLNLSQSGIKEILRRDSLFASEVEIFEAVRRWLVVNEVANPSAVMNCVRLPLLSMTELLTVVRPTGLISADELLDAIQAGNGGSADFRYRGYLVVEENVATSRYGAEVTVGEAPQFLLDGDTESYDLERGFTRHAIDDHGSSPRFNAGSGARLRTAALGQIGQISAAPPSSVHHQFFQSSVVPASPRIPLLDAPKIPSANCIEVRLGRPSILNHLKLLLWDRDSRAYSYYVEGSVDHESWEMLVDHSSAMCRSWQEIYFPARVLLYIRVVGTYNTANRVFHLVALEAYYTTRPFQLKNGVIVPRYNVASSKRGAVVIEGVSRSRDALLNGDTRNYDWDSGYTCHQLGGTAISLQLAQPYWISSMRLLLWDCDDRSYSYHIETSVNNRDWQMAVNKDRELCRSWQNIVLPEPRAVVYVRIVGVHNTANEVFHCVHFECPSTEVLAASNADEDGAENGGGERASGDARDPDEDGDDGVEEKRSRSDDDGNGTVRSGAGADSGASASVHFGHLSSFRLTNASASSRASPASSSSGRRSAV